jgi:signal transduction histidine kinase
MSHLPATEALLRPAPLARATPIRLTDRERLELLLEAGRTLDDSADLAASMQALGRLIAGRLGDVCVIDLIAGSVPVPIAVAHADLERADEAQELRRRHPPRAEDRVGVTEVLRTGHAELHTELPREADGLSAFRSIGVAAAMVAPIRTPGQVLGAITVLAAAERRCDGADLRVLEELGARAGLCAALSLARAARPSRSPRDHERLLAFEKEALEAAEVMMHRISTLQSVTAALSEAVTLEQVADVVVRESLTSLGARMGAVHLLDAAGQNLELIAQQGMTLAGAAATARLPLSHSASAVIAVRTGRPLWILGRDRVRAACPELARRLTGEGDPAALAAIPLAVGGRMAGVLALVFDEPDHLPEDDRVFALALVRHCAQAIERARLYEAERRSNQRLTLLARAGELLAASIDYETTLETVARVALPALADYAFLDVLEGGSARRLARAAREGVQPEAEAMLASLRELPGAPATEARLDAVVDEATLHRLAGGPDDVAVLGRLELVSLLTVPLVARDQALGVITLGFGPSGRRHTSADLEMALELARRAAIAVENAMLHRESHEAVQRAQEANRRSELANRSKDEFLGVVSHELRTPLNAVLGWSQLLRGPAGADAAVLAKGLRVIDRNARAQAKLIDDILDVSRIITGKLRLELRPLELESVIRAALEVVRPAADAKNIELCSSVETGAAVSGDPDRLQQVVWNILSNAVKFTPEGGRVEVALCRERAAATIRVRDSGRGIESDVLPYVFERFWQADSSPTRRHGGLGLGLAIVRHLVELHGGSVYAESAGPGLGSTFTVRLPARDDLPVLEGDAGARLSRDSDPTARGARLDGLRVLLVDDEEDARDLVATMLASAGAVVTVAGSATEAWALLAHHLPDVLVSDIGMPGEDGHALLRKVRASPRLCRLPALALTAYASPEDARRAVKAGFHTHLAKPAEPAMLTAVVATLAGRMT